MQKYYFDFSEDYYFPNKVKNKLEKIKRLKKLYGADEYGIINLPQKMSSAMATKYVNKANLNCDWCAPHKGCNKNWNSNLRNWKEYRKNHWKK